MEKRTLNLAPTGLLAPEAAPEVEESPTRADARTPTHADSHPHTHHHTHPRT